MRGFWVTVVRPEPSKVFKSGPCAHRNFAEDGWRKNMWIKSCRIRNYKSISNSGELHFGRHMNVVVGQNNVGKTVLLQAIQQHFSYSPHTSLSQKPGEALNALSQAMFEF